VTYRQDPIGYLLLRVFVVVAVLVVIYAAVAADMALLCYGLAGLAFTVLLVRFHGRAKNESDGWW
jgi:hypothetical protein